MSRRHTLLAALAAAALAGAAYVPAAAASTAGGGRTGLERTVGIISTADKALLPRTSELYAAYRAAPTPSPCPTGSISCVDKTVNIMTQRFDALAPTCSHDAVFSLLYLRVTQQYKVDATTPGFFVRPATVNTEDTVFSQLYSRSYNRWYADAPATVPPIWRLAFAAADADKTTGTGDAMLGMVAHIRRDLPFALYRIMLGNHADHEAINTMLAQVYPTAVDELARRFDPTIKAGNIVPGTDMALVDAIAVWRDQAWTDAKNLLAAGNSTDFAAEVKLIERRAWNTGLEVYLGTLTNSALNGTRDAYCATHWNG